LLLAAAASAAQPAGGVVRAERTSPYGRIRVTDYPATGLRCLEFPPSGALQSCMRRSRPTELVFPYLRSMLASLALHPNPRRVLVVGLGGGSLTRAIQRSFPYVRQTVVEIDPEVVQVCREFFGFVPTLTTQVEVGDARTFLGRTREVYDVIFLDAYGGEAIPHHLATVEFFRLVRSRLRPGGVVASNLWGPQVNELYQRQVATIAGSFPTAYLLRAGAGTADAGNDVSNHVIIAVLGEGVPLRQWVARAAQLQATGRIDFDLVEVLRHEVEVLTNAVFDVEPLRDRSRP
jgi:spermidine synthase